MQPTRIDEEPCKLDNRQRKWVQNHHLPLFLFAPFPPLSLSLFASVYLFPSYSGAKSVLEAVCYTAKKAHTPVSSNSQA